ncbi:MAG: hypothetical protein KF878_27950 [Planctomycetes bacterium]|nr:hypothetical protein [Planctomycetota bacterium]
MRLVSSAECRPRTRSAPADADPFLLRGALFLHAGQAAQARADAQEALRRAPPNRRAQAEALLQKAEAALASRPSAR